MGGKGAEGKGGGGGPPPPPPRSEAKAKSKAKAKAAAPQAKPALSLEEVRAKFKKVEVADKTKRPPTAVRGLKFWLNFPAKIREELPPGKDPQSDGGILELIPYLFDKQGAKAVLVDFFAYSCTNCLRVIPVLKRWHETYGPHGLVIVSFHRPEFDFERDAINMLSFVRREGVKYLVALDNEDAAWKDWSVTMWPSSFLVVRDEEGGAGAVPFKIIKEHYGDRNHHEVEALIKARTSAGGGKVEEYNNAYYADAEFFLGKEHRYKNVDGSNDPGCGEGACKIRDRATAVASAEVTLPAKEGRILYGAGWCRFCQKAKTLYQLMGLDFAFLDVDGMGGAAKVLAELKAGAGLPENHSTIPVIYTDGQFLGGWTELVTSLRDGRPDLDQLLGDVEAQTTATTADFDKFEHQLSASLEGGVTTPEFFLASEGAQIVLRIAMKSKADVHVFAVASLKDEDIQARREAAYAQTTSMAAVERNRISSLGDGGAALVEGADFSDLFADVSDPPGFAVSLAGQEQQHVPLAFPGRVLLATVPASGGDFVRNTLSVGVAANIKIYTFFLTSEPQ